MTAPAPGFDPPGAVFNPIGNGSWMNAISSNLSYVGVRGFQTLGNLPMNFVYQLETQIDVSATSGTGISNSNTSNQVKGGLTSRNSFIGLASPAWGAAKIGKTDAPYKTSTARMNPFVGMLGDYSVIMGNTGGDNRVEFGTRLDHAIWYESPNWNGVNFNALISPGQNRGLDSSNVASGESDCAGGNIPGSGGLAAACNDGSYSTAYSGSLSYTHGPLYITGAYEMHRLVNRTSDLGAYDPRDIADEDAKKIGLQYAFPTKTTVSVIWEDMKRKIDPALALQNERSRSGYWLALSQGITSKDSLHFGWAHANQTPGDPGQHNTIPFNGALGTANPDNTANMYTLAWKHQMDKNMSIYANWAETVNHQAAHYDLGAGGRGVTTDCHDASTPDGSGFDPAGGAPRCWAGGHLKGISLGMKYVF
jgi:predicted porin